MTLDGTPLKVLQKQAIILPQVPRVCQGFAVFDSYTCATWDPEKREEHYTVVPDSALKKSHGVSTTEEPAYAEACIIELDKPENYKLWSHTHFLAT